MLVILRIISTGLLLYFMYDAAEAARHSSTSDSTDLGMASSTGILVITAIFTAITWAPWIGARVADPMTTMMTDGTFHDYKYPMPRIIAWLKKHEYRRLTVLACFLEGLNRPHLPGAFVNGMRAAKPGWLRVAFAKEVFRFNNAANCLAAHRILMNNGIDPGPHDNHEINLFISSSTRQDAPERAAVPLIQAEEAPPVARNERIKLFDTPPLPGTDDGNGKLPAKEL